MKNINVIELGRLKKIIGEDAFQLLLTHCSGKNIYIPKFYDARYYNRKIRNVHLKADYIGGMTVVELMEKYSLSKTTIYKIIESK